MPQVKAEDIKPFDIYGKDEIDNSITFRERLMQRFQAHEHVQVMNIDDEPIQWQYLPDHAEKITMTDEGTRITMRDDPELWRIEPGETDVLIGGCAYIMIEALYKKLVIKKVGVVEHPESARQIRNFNFKDPIRAEQIIDMIYQGKVSPSFNQAQPDKIVLKKPDAKPLANKSKV
jgi:hypothetical protein